MQGNVALATQINITGETLEVELSDGRAISVPLGWYPRLAHATPRERLNNRLIAGGRGIHWPDLDEDISVANLLSGQASGESQKSFKRWLTSRKEAKQRATVKRSR